MLIKEPDYGTPASQIEAMVTLEIDGESVTVPAGTSVMRAAAEMGTKVPKLCATDSLNSFGSCRLCLVEIEGRRGTPASCTTPAENGMKVRTQTPRLAKLRRGVMELYISDHPLDCLTCAANGDCELQDMAVEVGLREVRYGYEGANHLTAEKDTSNPYFTFDPAKCIVCSRPCSMASCHTWLANSEPLASARFTSFAPWAKMRPAPSALWPTSLLPMSSSDGRPTATPCAHNCVDKGDASSASR